MAPSIGFLDSNFLTYFVGLPSLIFHTTMFIANIAILLTVSSAEKNHRACADLTFYMEFNLAATILIILLLCVFLYTKEEQKEIFMASNITLALTTFGLLVYSIIAGVAMSNTTCKVVSYSIFNIVASDIILEAFLCTPFIVMTTWAAIEFLVPSLCGKSADYV